MDYKQILENVSISISDIIDMLYDIDETSAIIDMLYQLECEIDGVLNNENGQNV